MPNDSTLNAIQFTIDDINDALDAPILCSEVAVKVCYTPAEWETDPLDGDMQEQLMNAGALR